MPKFDLEADVAAEPPKRWKRPSSFDSPRIQEWLGQLLSLRAEGYAVTNAYIAEKLTKGARLEGLIPADESISADAVTKYLQRRPR